MTSCCWLGHILLQSFLYVGSTLVDYPKNHFTGYFDALWFYYNHVVICVVVCCSYGFLFNINFNVFLFSN